MIENKIDELIAAINAGNATMKALGESLRALHANPQLACYIKPEEQVEAAPEVEAPAPKIKAEKAKDEAPAPKAASAADKIADMENRCRALARKDPKAMRVAILDLLESYGSKTIKGVPEGKLDELSDKLAELEG